MKKKTWLTIIMIVALIASGLIIINFDKTKPNYANIKQIVNDYSTGKITNESASITSQQLIVTKNNGKKTTFELPENEFFVSIAPYIETTHPCAIHSLTGCRGELIDNEFDIQIKDDNGQVIKNEKIKSQSNGFIDLWLPRDQTYHITIKYDGKKVESQISTFKEDNTCITTMQLEETI
ncbi:MAG: CueP family metal-binding protein [Candidatus Cohnella colombiensis]|uniref:CueP family metal-binding protein n=1 Tax=Candidatus Cohnella colombiensis TaxID=3121368 RepID=A0AA95F316_9BACL|nr:MAG: CueP family metal-binding protein [Cohnella sp.]